MSVKISELTAAVSIDPSDLVAIVDVSASETKKATLTQLLAVFGSAPGAPDKSLQYRVSATAFGGEGEWTREAAGRLNVSTSGFATYGAVGGTYAEAGFLRLAQQSGEDSTTAIAGSVSGTSRPIVQMDAAGPRFGNSALPTLINGNDIRLDAGSGPTSIDGYLELGTDVGDVAQSGDLRLPTGEIDGDGWVAMFRSGNADRDVAAIGVYTDSGGDGVRDLLYLGDWAGDGSDAVHRINAGFIDAAAFYFLGETPEGQQVGWTAGRYEVDPADEVIVDFPERRVLALHRHMNPVVYGARSTLVDPENALAGGEGVFYLGAAEVVPDPEIGPTLGITLWTQPSTHVLKYMKPGGSIVTLDGMMFGSDGSTKTITTAGNIDNADIDEASVVVFTGANPVLRGIAGGSPGRRVMLINRSSDLMQILTDQISSAEENRLLGAGGGYYLPDNNCALSVVYDDDEERWVVDFPWVPPPSDLTGELVDTGAAQTLSDKTILTDTNTLTSGGAAAGDMLVSDGTKYQRLAKGSDGQVLKMVAGAVTWAAP